MRKLVTVAFAAALALTGASPAFAARSLLTIETHPIGTVDARVFEALELRGTLPCDDCREFAQQPPQQPEQATGQAPAPPPPAVAPSPPPVAPPAPVVAAPVPPPVAPQPPATVVVTPGTTGTAAQPAATITTVPMVVAPAQPASAQTTVQTTGPVSSETTINVGTLAGQALMWMVTTFGTVLGSAGLILLQRWFKRMGIEISDKDRTRVQEIVVNGINSRAQEIAERLKGQGQIAIKNAIVANAVTYVQEHGAETLKRLGVDPTSPAAVEAIKARIETAIQDPNQATVVEATAPIEVPAAPAAKPAVAPAPAPAPAPVDAAIAPAAPGQAG